MAKLTRPGPPCAPPANRRLARAALAAPALTLLADVSAEPGHAGAGWVAVVWALAGGVAAFAAVRVAGLDRGVLMAQLMAFTPYVAVAALVPLAASVLIGAWVAAAVAALAWVALTVCVLPRAFGSPSTVAGSAVRVMTANLRLGGADAKSIVDVVREQAVDLLAVQEFTGEAAANLAGAGLDDLLPHAVRRPRPGAGGSALYSRFPLSDASDTVNPGRGFHQASAAVAVPGGPVEVHSVHPDPPVARAAWAAGLRAQVPAGPGRPLRILAGDFNATLDHGLLRRLLATGYRDAAAAVGRGLVPTWPYHGPRIAWLPKVGIDHVLVHRALGVRDVTAVRVPETDHRALIATVVVPRD